MQTYETLFVTTPTLTEEEEQSIVEGLAQIVTDGGGLFAANERMGRRRLAYPIEKHNDGVYVRFLYDSDVDVPKELERRLRLSERILRVLTVRLEPKWAVAAKEQAVRDAQARVEAAEREKVEREEAERKALEEPVADSAEPAADSAKPAPDSAKPDADSAEPAADSAKPAPEASASARDAAGSGDEIPKPSDGGE